MTIKTHDRFITFEGGEGAGKSTQIQKVKDYLNDKGFDVVITREPGGTDVAEALRDIIVKDNGYNLSPEMELSVITSGRLHHLENLIIPALNGGKFVLCDRYIDSTYVYQGYSGGIEIDKITELHKNILADNFILPIKTFFIDVDAQTGLARSGGAEKGEDRFENKEFEFHEKIRAGFKDLKNKNPQRIIEINGSGDIEAVTNDIINEMDKVLNENGKTLDD